MFSDCGNKVRMYCWSETVCGRGSDEVISCLFDYFNSLPQKVTTLYLYSNGCGRQNKLLFTLAVHVYTVRGHPKNWNFGCNVVLFNILGRLAMQARLVSVTGAHTQSMAIATHVYYFAAHSMLTKLRVRMQ